MKLYWMAWSWENLKLQPSGKFSTFYSSTITLTWWECGRSYLCRMIDMIHMGYVDEVVFGREVLTRLPELAREWKTAYDALES